MNYRSSVGINEIKGVLRVLFNDFSKTFLTLNDIFHLVGLVSNFEVKIPPNQQNLASLATV